MVLFYLVGLGFKIRGGTDMPYVPGHSGIFITHMDETGAASLDGRLKVGDRVLEVTSGFTAVTFIVVLHHLLFLK